MTTTTPTTPAASKYSPRQNHCRDHGIAVRERLHALAWAAHDAGQRPTLADLSRRMHMHVSTVGCHVIRLRDEGRWPWVAGRDRPIAPRLGLAEAHRLATLPGSIALARRMARSAGRRCRRLEDEYESAAMAALWDAAIRYDGRDGVPFQAFATIRIKGAIKTTNQLAVEMGYRDRRRETRATARGRSVAHESRPRVVSMSRPIEGTDGDLTIGDAAGSGEMPVGWEVDEHDAVEYLAGKARDQLDRDAVLMGFMACEATRIVREKWGVTRDEVYEARARGMTAIRWYLERERVGT